MLQPEDIIETLQIRIQILKMELAELLAKNAEKGEITAKKEEIAEVLFEVGTEYYNMEEYNACKNVLEQIVYQNNPNEYRAWNNLGVIYDHWSNSKQAIECYQKSLEINDQYSEAWNNLGVLYEKSGELEKAKPCFQKAKILLERIVSQENQKLIQESYEAFIFHYQNSLIKGSSENQNQFGKENLAFAIKKLAIQDFQSIRNLEINIPTDAQFVCFLGLNGDGKTSILQALAMGLQGAEGAMELLNENFASKIGVEFLEKTENQIHNLYREEHAWTSFAKCSNTMGYGAKRLAVTDKVREDWKKINPFECLFKHKDEDLLNIERWLVDDLLEQGTETALAKQMMACLQKLMPSVSKVSRKKSRIVYEEFGKELTFLQLSAGNKAIVSLVGDILIRLIEQNPDTENLPDLAGIVLIDELETHLHPKWQKEFPKILSEIFPKVQFIITTHSAICLLGMPPNTAFYKVQRTENEGTTVEKIALDMQNLLPNQILTSILFELDIIPSFNQNVNEIDTATTYQETERRKKLDEKLVELSKKLKS